MERRKFLLGMGAVAAGGAAALGTGAFSSAAAYREANFLVTSDDQAFLTLTAPNSLENGEYAALENGQLVLNFNGDADVNGEGLGAESQYWFDDVFTIANNGANEVRAFVDDDRLTISENVVFYQGQTQPSGPDNPGEGFSLSGATPSAEGPFFADDDRTAEGLGNNSYWAVIGPGESTNIGVYIDTRSLGTGDLNQADNPIVVKGGEPE